MVARSKGKARVTPAASRPSVVTRSASIAASSAPLTRSVAASQKNDGTGGGSPKTVASARGRATRTSMALASSSGGTNSGPDEATNHLQPPAVRRGCQQTSRSPASTARSELLGETLRTYSFHFHNAGTDPSGGGDNRPQTTRCDSRADHLRGRITELHSAVGTELTLPLPLPATRRSRLSGGERGDGGATTTRARRAGACRSPQFGLDSNSTDKFSQVEMPAQTRRNGSRPATHGVFEPIAVRSQNACQVDQTSTRSTCRGRQSAATLDPGRRGSGDAFCQTGLSSHESAKSGSPASAETPGIQPCGMVTRLTSAGLDLSETDAHQRPVKSKPSQESPCRSVALKHPPEADPRPDVSPDPIRAMARGAKKRVLTDADAVPRLLRNKTGSKGVQLKRPPGIKTAVKRTVRGTTPSFLIPSSPFSSRTRRGRAPPIGHLMPRSLATAPAASTSKNETTRGGTAAAPASVGTRVLRSRTSRSGDADTTLLQKADGMSAVTAVSSTDHSGRPRARGRRNPRRASGAAKVADNEEAAPEQLVREPSPKRRLISTAGVTAASERPRSRGLAAETSSDRKENQERGEDGSRSDVNELSASIPVPKSLRSMLVGVRTLTDLNRPRTTRTRSTVAKARLADREIGSRTTPATVVSEAPAYNTRSRLRSPAVQTWTLRKPPPPTTPIRTVPGGSRATSPALSSTARRARTSAPGVSEDLSQPLSQPLHSGQSGASIDECLRQSCQRSPSPPAGAPRQQYPAEPPAKRTPPRSNSTRQRRQATTVEDASAGLPATKPIGGCRPPSSPLSPLSSTLAGAMAGSPPIIGRTPGKPSSANRKNSVGKLSPMNAADLAYAKEPSPSIEGGEILGEDTESDFPTDKFATRRNLEYYEGISPSLQVSASRCHNVHEPGDEFPRRPASVIVFHKRSSDEAAPPPTARNVTEETARSTTTGGDELTTSSVLSGAPPIDPIRGEAVPPVSLPRRTRQRNGKVAALRGTQSPIQVVRYGAGTPAKRAGGQSTSATAEAATDGGDAVVDSATTSMHLKSEALQSRRLSSQSHCRSASTDDDPKLSLQPPASNSSIEHKDPRGSARSATSLAVVTRNRVSGESSSRSSRRESRASSVRQLTLEDAFSGGRFEGSVAQPKITAAAQELSGTTPASGKEDLASPRSKRRRVCSPVVSHDAAMTPSRFRTSQPPQSLVGDDGNGPRLKEASPSSAIERLARGARNRSRSRSRSVDPTPTRLRRGHGIAGEGEPVTETCSQVTVLARRGETKRRKALVSLDAADGSASEAGILEASTIAGTTVPGLSNWETAVSDVLTIGSSGVSRRSRRTVAVERESGGSANFRDIGRALAQVSSEERVAGPRRRREEIAVEEGNKMVPARSEAQRTVTETAIPSVVARLESTGRASQKQRATKQAEAVDDSMTHSLDGARERSRSESRTKSPSRHPSDPDVSQPAGLLAPQEDFHQQFVRSGTPIPIAPTPELIDDIPHSSVLVEMKQTAACLRKTLRGIENKLGAMESLYVKRAHHSTGDILNFPEIHRHGMAFAAIATPLGLSTIDVKQYQSGGGEFAEFAQPIIPRNAMEILRDKRTGMNRAFLHGFLAPPAQSWSPSDRGPAITLRGDDPVARLTNSTIATREIPEGIPLQDCMFSLSSLTSRASTKLFKLSVGEVARRVPSAIIDKELAQRSESGTNELTVAMLKRAQ